MLDLFPRPVVTTEKGGSNASNNIIRITIWRGVECFAAVLAQEVYERSFKRLLLILVGSPFAAAAWLSVHPYAAVVGLLAGLAAPILKPLRERMELMGHAIETAVANRCYGRDLETYELKEARSLTGGSYRDKGLFKDKSVEQITALLKERRGKADRWVTSRWPMIGRFADARA